MKLLKVTLIGVIIITACSSQKYFKVNDLKENQIVHLEMKKGAKVSGVIRKIDNNSIHRTEGKAAYLNIFLIFFIQRMK